MNTAVTATLPRYWNELNLSTRKISQLFFICSYLAAIYGRQLIHGSTKYLPSSIVRLTLLIYYFYMLQLHATAKDRLADTFCIRNCFKTIKIE